MVYFYKKHSSIATVRLQVWSKGKTLVSFTILNQDIIIIMHSVATVAPKTFGRPLKDMQRGMQETSFLL